MVVFEALDALQGDCLLLRLPGTGGREVRWLIDAGPLSGRVGSETRRPWRDNLLRRLDALGGGRPHEIALGVCTHIDDDHIAGMRLLVRKMAEASPLRSDSVTFRSFWFNSLSAILRDPTSGVASTTRSADIGRDVDRAVADLRTLAPEAVLASIGRPLDETAAVAVQSIGQGIDLESDLTRLGLDVDLQFPGAVVSGGGAFDLDGARVTVLGPRPSRLDGLRKEWQKALARPAATRAAAVAELFLPKGDLDAAFANLSSIVMLVEAEGRRLLLTGDALGDDVVAAWRSDLGKGATPCPVDVLKMPHHGSIRNVSEAFLETFPADHYVFSANGKYDNPDAPTIEAVARLAAKQGREVTLHFTNGDVTWSTAQTVAASGATAETLDAFLTLLKTSYGGGVKTRVRAPEAPGIVIELPAKAPAG